MTDALAALQKRAKSLADEARTHLQEAEKRGWTEADDKRADELQEQIRSVDARLKDIMDSEVREAGLADSRSKYLNVISGATDEDDASSSELRKWVRGQMKDSGEYTPAAIELNMSDTARREVRTLSKLSAGAGANLVPTSFHGKLYEHQIESSSIRQTNATIITTQSGEALQVPKTTAHGGAALVAEAGTIAASDPTFGQVTLNAYKYGVLIQVSNELVTDTGFDLESYLARQAGRSVGNASGAHFVSGDGTNKPQGIVPAATVGVTAAATTAITGDELMDLYFSVAPSYRRNGYWMMSDAAFKVLRKLKTGVSGDNTYLWGGGNITEGDPLRLLDRPVVIDPNMDAPTAGLKPIIFGDFSAYTIRDVGSVRFERSDEFAWNQDLVTFRCLQRTDGDLLDTAAVKTLQMAAS